MSEEKYTAWTSANFSMLQTAIERQGSSAAEHALNCNGETDCELAHQAAHDFSNPYTPDFLHRQAGISIHNSEEWEATFKAYQEGRYIAPLFVNIRSEEDCKAHDMVLYLDNKELLLNKVSSERGRCNYYLSPSMAIEMVTDLESFEIHAYHARSSMRSVRV